MEDYTVLGRIGEGAHGIVMRGRHKKSGSIVALKKVLLKRLEDGIPETALREIKALQVGHEINLSFFHKFSLLRMKGCARITG